MNKIYLLIAILAFLAASCDDLVEVDNPTDQIGTAVVYEDKQTAYAALAGLYSELRDGSVITGGYYYSACSLLDSYADNLDCYSNDQNGVMDIYQNQQLEGNTVIASLWKKAYSQIYYANSIIKGVEQSETLKEEDKKQIKGEALFVRSLIYFYLNQLFGDIPYTTSLNYENNRHLKKMPTSSLLKNLEIDIKEAIDLLSDDYRDAERIYPNRKASELLLTKIYLQQGDWANADQLAGTILGSPLYEFQTDINEVFHKDGTHILWQLKPQNSGDATKEATFYYFDNAAPNSYALTANLTELFIEEDLRKQMWMTPVTYNDNTWYRPYKYKNRTNGSNPNEYSVVLRLAEVNFIRAEALIKLNRPEEALPLLNATRNRAGLAGLTTIIIDELTTELLAEKRREFFTEYGHRFIDLKRWDRLNELESKKPNWENYNNVWPLPQNELLLNTNLNPQNTGY